MDAVTCPVGRKIGRGGHVEGCIVPSWKKNRKRWSRRGLHRSQLEEKSVEAVTQEAASYPVGRKIGRVGHVRARIVPSWKKNRKSWSR